MEKYYVIINGDKMFLPNQKRSKQKNDRCIFKWQKRN